MFYLINSIKSICRDPFDENSWKLRLLNIFVMFFWVFLYFFVNLSSSFYLISAGFIISVFGFFAKNKKNEQVKLISLSVVFLRRLYKVCFIFFTSLILFELISSMLNRFVFSY